MGKVNFVWNSRTEECAVFLNDIFFKRPSNILMVIGASPASLCIYTGVRARVTGTWITFRLMRFHSNFTKLIKFYMSVFFFSLSTHFFFALVVPPCFHLREEKEESIIKTVWYSLIPFRSACFFSRRALLLPQRPWISLVDFKYLRRWSAKNLSPPLDCSRGI